MTNRICILLILTVLFAEHFNLCNVQHIDQALPPEDEHPMVETRRERVSGFVLWMLYGRHD
jgi:hypothetical protein